MHFLRAVKPIFRDLLSTILFVSLFLITGNIFWATGFGIAFGIAQTLWMKLTGRPIGPLQWLSLMLITVFGTTTIVTHNAMFIKFKPTIVWIALGAVMLRRDWMAPYLPPIVTENLDDHLIVRAGYAWAALMFALSGLNLLVAFTMTTEFWAVYALIGPAIGQLALLIAQYLMFRKLVIGKIRARQSAQTA